MQFKFKHSFWSAMERYHNILWRDIPLCTKQILNPLIVGIMTNVAHILCAISWQLGSFGIMTSSSTTEKVAKLYAYTLRKSPRNNLRRENGSFVTIHWLAVAWRPHRNGWGYEIWTIFILQKMIWNRCGIVIMWLVYKLSINKLS